MSKAGLISELFLTFFRIGAFTFGGGYAMIPLIEEETVNRKHWIKEEDILDVVAISESTPGPIAINAATFVGYKTAGFAGAAAATMGVILPSFVIILLISSLLIRFSEYTYVVYALKGIRAGVLALIAKAMISMWKKCRKGGLAYLIMAAAFVLTAFFRVNAVYVILGSAAAGILSGFYAKKGAGTL